MQSISVVLGRRHRLLHVRALLAKRNGGEQEICPVHHGSLFDSQNVLHQAKGDPTGTVAGRSQGITSTTSRIRSRRNTRRTSWVSTTGSSETRSSARTCLISVARKKICREMDKLANGDHTHHITPEEVSVYRNNWWTRSNTVGSDTMPIWHRPIWLQASIVDLATVQTPRRYSSSAKMQSSFSSWWNWQESWWQSSFEHHHEDGPSPELIRETCWQVWATHSRVWFLRMNLMQCSSKFGRQLTIVHCHPTGSVNTVPPPIQQNPT